MTDMKSKTDQQWKSELSDQEYYVCREKGTERPFTGKYWDNWQQGVYRCRCCGTALFSSVDKFDAGCGWPSFSSVLDDDNVDEHFDSSHGMRRTEVTCHHCDAHLGHVFPDGPAPTGLRYCINSVSIQLEPSDEN